MLALFYQIFTFANVTFMLKGLAMSVAIAVLATVISMFFGTILALIRTYANGPFQWASCPCCCIHGVFPLHAKPAVDPLDLFHHQGK